MGRPSDYNDDVVSEICERIALGESLRSICLDDDLPDRATVMRWLQKHEAFRDQYAHARDKQAETYAEDIVYIADTEDDPQKAKVRIDARKWVAMKLLPKKYGDKASVELTGKDGGAIIVDLTQPEADE